MLVPSPTLRESVALYSIVVQLGAAEKGHIPATLGRAIHSQVMQWLQLGDAAVAQAVHSSQVAPLGLSGLIGRRRKGATQPDDSFYFRISLLDGDLLEPLLEGVEVWGPEPISLGKFPFILRSVEALPGGHQQVRIGDYNLLCRAAPTRDDIALEFTSPTSFKQQKTIQPFPLPDLVYGSLLRRWNTFAPQRLHLPNIEWQGMVSAFDLHTRALRLEGGPEIGSVGWVKYRFPDPEQARIATILAHYAFYAGVGRKTTMGMGQATMTKPQ